MRSEELIDFLASLDGEETRSFEVKLTEFARDNTDDEIKDKLRTIIDSDVPERVRYAAFYCLNILLRRVDDYHKAKELFDEYTDAFSDHKTFSHLYTLYCIESGSMYDYDEILEMTYKDTLSFTENAGFIHLFADVFVTIYESGGITNEKRYLGKWLDKALQAVNKAIELDPKYAKYYCTKGRIACIKGDYREAERLINKAIDLEDSSRKDYLLRINMYQYHKIMVKTEERLNRKPSEIVEKDMRSFAKKVGLKEAYNGDKPYVFISYAHEDAEMVYSIVSKMQKKGIRVWIDRNGIKGNSDYSEFIAKTIIDCASFVFMVSDISVNKEYVRKEVKMAVNKSKNPLCVYIESTQLPPGLELDLLGRQHISIYDPEDEVVFNSLLDSLPDCVKSEA